MYACTIQHNIRVVRFDIKSYFVRAVSRLKYLKKKQLYGIGKSKINRVKTA